MSPQGLRWLARQIRASCRDGAGAVLAGLWPWPRPPWRMIWAGVLVLILGPWVVWGILRYGLWVSDVMMGRRAP